MDPRRLLDDSDGNGDSPPEPKRSRTARPSLASVIGEVLKGNSLQNICSALEPVLRKVVSEEVERGLGLNAPQPIHRSNPPLQIKAPELESTLQLCFAKRISQPVFTGSKIEDEEGKPLRILLVHVQGNQRVPTSLPYPIKVEIVVLYGDFLANEECKDWTKEQFNDKIVRERTGKRPLITGDVILTLRHGSAQVAGLTFTDNSSWIRSRTFRLGARVVPGTCSESRILEAFTKPFVVRDHRGELYKKHHPPSLSDEVWRLEKIGKDGAFHGRLDAGGINTVQDLLKLWVVDHTRLRAILGNGMSDKVFEVMIKHASTCIMGNKQYVLRTETQTVVFNPICQLVGFMVDEKICSTRDLVGLQRGYIEDLVRCAYTNWNSLEVVDGQPGENTLPSQD
ncbi:hypothetical protein Sjap_024928 [Stephania japonica]|uniref:Uncharacterized protein n=1 Tax=Stephania japonica TaxID=461633 RepID=A0AAP0EE86_9MAGN